MVLSDQDRELLNRCLAGMDGSWEAFIDKYLPLITHVVNSTCATRVSRIPDEVRDDLIAEILLALVDDEYAILRRFRGQSSLGTYLVVVARRIAARRLSKMKTPVTENMSGAGMVQSLESGIELDNREEVQELLMRLPDSEATAIRMFHLEHRTYTDIGHRLGIPENSVGPLLSRARDAMRLLRG